MKIEILKKEIVDLLNSRLTNQLQVDYNQLISLLMTYRGFISVDELQDILACIVSDHKLSTYQVEMIVEISNRLSGFCSNHVRIDWN